MYILKIEKQKRKHKFGKKLIVQFCIPFTNLFLGTGSTSEPGERVHQVQQPD